MLKKNQSIKLKATFLMAVLALNSVVGFACSVGLDMGFNSKHHHDDEAMEAVVHIHKDGKKHIHQEKKESHDHDKSHQHEEANNNHQSGNAQDGCCNDKVRNFEQLDKSVPNSLSVVHPIFFTAFVAAYFHISVLLYTDIVKDIKQFVRSYHPPIPDIRIAIQSFQI